MSVHALNFGLPFLELDNVICDHKQPACIVKDKNLNYNLLTPHTRQEPKLSKLRLCDQLLRNKSLKKEVMHELLANFPKKWKDHLLPNIPKTIPNYITLIMHHIENLEIEASMENMDTNLRKTFSRVFQPIPHVDELPLEPLAWITLKDAEKIIKTRNYACP